MTLSLTSVNLSLIPEDGGHEIEITGVFELGNQHRVHIGPTGTSADEQCYSGIPGQGNIVYPSSATLLRAYSPKIVPTGPYDIFVVDLDTTTDDTLLNVITAIYRDYQSSVFNLRKVLPPFYKTGPRDIDIVEIR